MQKRLARFANLIGLIVALPAVYIYFCWRVPSFRTLNNLETIGRQSTIVILVALGMTFVIISAGIDLSVGSVAAFGSVVIALCLKAGMSPLVAAGAGILSGTAIGLITGGIITQLRVVPFIVTLGSFSMVRGAAKGISDQQKVDAPDSWLNNILESLDAGHRWMIFPVGVWVAILFTLLSAWILRYTRFGRYVVAIGSNEQAARLCGVPINRVKTVVYLISGFFAGLAGLMYFSRLTVGDPTVAVGLELSAIAAVVIGGASLNGGEGSVIGSVIGALIMQVLSSGLVQIGYESWVQEIVTGAIIVIAVAIDQIRRGKVTDQHIIAGCLILGAWVAAMVNSARHMPTKTPVVVAILVVGALVGGALGFFGLRMRSARAQSKTQQA